MTTTFVLVHGAFCNAAVWAPTVRELALRGHRALAVDLPGHGLAAAIPTGYLGGQDPEALATQPSGIAGIGTADDVAAVTDVLRRVREHGPVVLAGASRGGLTLTAVGNGDPEVLDRLQEALLADGTREELLAYLHTQDPDEALAVDEQAIRADAATWGRIPRTYVRLTADRAIPLALQDRFIAEADALTPGNPTDVRSIESSHLRFQIHPTELVEILAGLAVDG